MDKSLDIDPATEAFYSGALSRIQRAMAVIGCLGTVAALLLYGWRISLGFAFGAVIAGINFVWLKRVVFDFAGRVTQDGTQQSGRGIVLRFLLRYFLMGLGAYVIFSVSPASLRGLFAGLFLPVGAIACEAAYEAYSAVARGT